MYNTLLFNIDFANKKSLLNLVSINFFYYVKNKEITMLGLRQFSRY